MKKTKRYYILIIKFITKISKKTLKNSVHSSSSPLIRPSLFFQRQISSSDGGLAATLVGSPPRRFDAGVTE